MAVKFVDLTGITWGGEAEQDKLKELIESSIENFIGMYSGIQPNLCRVPGDLYSQLSTEFTAYFHHRHGLKIEAGKHLKNRLLLMYDY